ncbi:MAG: rhodanese-like domain-containing protein [Acidimicrobiia bacterium]
MTIAAADMVAEAKGRVENLSPSEFHADASRGALVVDIREPHEVEASGKIPGAVMAPRGMLEFWADPSSPYHRLEFLPTQRTLVYCASGGRSALAADTLRTMGYDAVAHLDGGITAWTDTGHEVAPA